MAGKTVKASYSGSICLSAEKVQKAIEYAKLEGGKSLTFQIDIFPRGKKVTLTTTGVRVRDLELQVKKSGYATIHFKE